MREETGPGIEEGNQRHYVLRACRSMLRPLVRMLLKSGIVYRDLLGVIREVYVEIARSEFGLRGRPTSISRVALLTGLARKEVRRIANEIDSGAATRDPPNSQDRIARVLSGWFQDQDYVDGSGQPLAIPAEGPAPSFADLKARYGGDVPASAILRELVNSGTIERDAAGLLRPVTRYFMPNPTNPEHVLRAGSVLEDVGNTVVRNLFRSEDDPSWFERRATNASVPESALGAFRAFLEREGQKFLEDTDEWLSRHENPREEQSRIRIGVGMYIIKDDGEEK